MSAMRMDGSSFAESYDLTATPLNRSAHLVRLSNDDVGLSRLYGHRAIDRSVADQQWRFRWSFFEGPIRGTELKLRIDGSDVSVGMEDFTLFGTARDVLQPGVPEEIRAAYLNAIGATVWSEISAVLGRQIELVAVHINRTLTLTPAYVTFEISLLPSGPATRGFIGPVSPNLRDLLHGVSDNHRVHPPLSVHLPIDWAAVVGTTKITASELSTLEIHDVVLVDDASHSADALECQLAVGIGRRRVGRAALRTGELRMLQFNASGVNVMTNSDDPPARVRGIRDPGLADIPVVLRFELAQWQAPLSEVSELTSGQVIDLGRRIDSQSLLIWVGQRCIGRGQLVAIGERLGVRVLSMIATGERDETPALDERPASAEAAPSS